MSETARTQFLDSLNTLDPTGTFTSQTSTSDGQHRHEEKRRKHARPAGTLNYVAPEMVVHEAYGRMVDWWACGVTFYECAMGSKLFGAGKRRSVESVLNEILCRNVDFTELTKLSEIQRNNVQPQDLQVVL